MGLGSALALLLIQSLGGCTSSPSGPTQPPLHAVAGGCAGTVVTDSEPPVWAQSGFRHTTPWPVPWALGTPGDAVVMLFARQLVAGGNPRIDGTNNKVHWVVRDTPFNFVVEGRPVGRSQPVIGGPGGSGIENVPTAGCWTFRVLWGAHNEHSSTINLEVLPAGTLPAK
jgi:hypothetical protein